MSRFGKNDDHKGPIDIPDYSKWWEETAPASEDLVQTPSSHVVFLSYAREDLEAATRLYEDLRGIGGDVAWFDKSNIMAGDIWSAKTQAAIQSCKLFLPMISANTERRDEGEFRREWKKALERADAIDGRNFIFPIVLDEGYTGNARAYKLVPRAFCDFHYGHAPGGRMSDELRADIQQQLSGLRRSHA